jgi:hypothetical protein
VVIANAVATPAGDIWTWEPGGDPVQDEALTKLIATYRREHAPLVESLVPPTLFGWDDLVVVLDRPLATEEIRDASGRRRGRNAKGFERVHSPLESGAIG